MADFSSSFAPNPRCYLANSGGTNILLGCAGSRCGGSPRCGCKPLCSNCDDDRDDDREDDNAVAIERSVTPSEEDRLSLVVGG
jgi:hypothetical protein